jgi:diguanylate cyclase (GGDEF)-like protein
MKPPIPLDEQARLRALQRYEILDTPSEQEYDDIALLAAQICGTPIATITLVDENRQWFKSKIGLEVSETSRDIAFCAYAVMPNSQQTMVVEDTLKDKRFAENPLVTGNPNIRFYAGAPLVTPDNHAIGTICVIDREPRDLSEAQLQALQALARQVTLKLELRRMSTLLQAANEDLRNLSLKDDLTGLFNRRGFLFHAEQQLKLFRSRKNGQGLWLMLGDMDGLKKINDTYGHEEGSAAIIEVSRILRKTFRDADVIARLGGDEFVVLIINALDEVAEKISERLAKNVSEYNLNTTKPYQLSISYGLTSFASDDVDSIEEAIKIADEMMYQNKRAHKKDRR